MSEWAEFLILRKGKGIRVGEFIEDKSVLPPTHSDITPMHYRTYRTEGGLKGLGTGARSYIKGRTKNPQKQKFQNILQTIPNNNRRFKPETKVVDITPTTVLIENAMTLSYFNLIQEGVGNWNRIGRKINMKSLYITGLIAPTNANTAALAEDYNRIIVFYDRQANGANITFANLIQSRDQIGTGVSNTALDHINMDNRERFIVLMDRRIVTPPIGANGVTATNNNITMETNGEGSDGNMKIQRYIKLQGLETHYSNTTNPAVIGNISTGALGMVVISVNATGNSRAYNFVYTARLKFIDV